MQHFSKQNVQGSVSVKTISIIAVSLLVALFFISYFTIGNQGARQEAVIEGTYRNNQSILSSCAVSIRNISKIPDKYRQDLESIIKTEMEGRYGGQGTDRVAIFVQERALNYDPKMREKVQNEIIACESRFALNQAKLIEQQTDYETMLNSAYSGAMLKAGGYPKKDMTKFKIVVDGGVKEQFDTGVRQDYDIK